MNLKKLMFPVVLSCLLILSLGVGCGDDDDDDDDNDNPSTDDDDDSCTMESMCEFAMDCGIEDFDSVDDCVAQQQLGADNCENYDEILACSCDCAEQYPTDCTKAMDCGMACWENADCG